MANRSNHNDIALAEKLFLYENKTCIEIAEEIGKNRRTIETWKKKFGWDEKRAGIIESRRALPQQLFEDYSLIMKSIREDLAAGKEVSQQRYRLANQLFEQIPKAAEVEKAAAGAAKEKKVSEAEIINAFREFAGLNDSEPENKTEGENADPV